MSKDGTIKAELNARSDAGATERIPVEVRDVRGIVRKRGLVGDSLTLPPGRYFVSARTPEGLEWNSTTAVDLSEGDEKQVELYSDDQQQSVAAAPLTSDDTADANSAEIGAVVRAVSVIRCERWLEHWMSLKNGIESGRVARHAVTDSEIKLVDDGERDTLIEVVTSRQVDGVTRESAAYFVVPFDGGRPTRVRVVNAVGRPPNVQFQFEDPTINDFLSHVSRGDTGNSKSVAQSYAPEARSLRSQSRAPLGQAIAAYVLLRSADDAKKLMQLDSWSAGLFQDYRDQLPDALPLRVEILARLGRHREIIDLGVASVRVPRLPWFRSGIGYLNQRIDQHLQVVKNNVEKMVLLTPEQMNAYEVFLGALDRLTWAIDDTVPTCVFRDMTPLN